MAVRLRNSRNGTRLQLGASLLSAAREVDTRLVKERLKRFEQVHKSYATAQRKVDTAEGELEAAMVGIERLDAVQDHAVERLACALSNDGQPRKNPFAAFGAPSPSTVARQPFAEEVDTVHRLVATIQRSKGVSKETLEAAQAADEAASAVEQALVPITKLEQTVADARRNRDAIAKVWETALAALRRGARAAADDGAPDLYPTLFKSFRVTGKPKTTEATTDPQPPAATPNAA
jgi:hypothetical protein